MIQASPDPSQASRSILFRAGYVSFVVCIFPCLACKSNRHLRLKYPSAVSDRVEFASLKSPTKAEPTEFVVQSSAVSPSIQRPHDLPHPTHVNSQQTGPLQTGPLQTGPLQSSSVQISPPLKSPAHNAQTDSDQVAVSLTSSATSTALVLPSQSAIHNESTVRETLALPDHEAASALSLPNVRLVVDRVRAGQGDVKVAVYTSASEFPNPMAANQTLALAATQPRIETNLSVSGRFAVAVYQDINSDGELNRNRIGIPTEPFAFSNNAKVSRGPPSFDQASIDPKAAVAGGEGGAMMVLINLP